MFLYIVLTHPLHHTIVATFTTLTRITVKLQIIMLNTLLGIVEADGHFLLDLFNVADHLDPVQKYS